MLYRHIFYLILIILAEIILYLSLTYGYFHTENHFQIQGLGNLDQYQKALIRFNIFVFFMHIVITSISSLYLKNDNKTLPLILIAVINLIITFIFFLLGVYDNYINVQEANIFTDLRSNIFYADIYYTLPMLWAILYSIYIYSKIKSKRS